MLSVHLVGVTSLGSGMMSGPSSTTPLKKAEFLVRVWRAIMPPMEWPYRNIGSPAPCPAPAPPAFTRAQCRITSWTRDTRDTRDTGHAGHVILVIHVIHVLHAAASLPGHTPPHCPPARAGPRCGRGPVQYVDMLICTKMQLLRGPLARTNGRCIVILTLIKSWLGLRTKGQYNFEFLPSLN